MFFKFSVVGLSIIWFICLFLWFFTIKGKATQIVISWCAKRRRFSVKERLCFIGWYDCLSVFPLFSLVDSALTLSPRKNGTSRRACTVRMCCSLPYTSTVEQRNYWWPIPHKIRQRRYNTFKDLSDCHKCASFLCNGAGGEKSGFKIW